MDRSQKQDLVDKMRDVLESSAIVIVARQAGLTVSELTALRRLAREKESNVKVVKNTLSKLAIKGTKVEAISSLLEGPVLLAFSSDSVALSKILSKFSKDNEKISILGGCLDGNLLNASQVEALASLPTLDELRSQFIALIQAPATKVVRVIKEPSARLARVCFIKGNE